MINHELSGLGGGTLSGLIAAHARWAPGNTALAFYEQHFTYGDIDAQASQVGAGLVALGLTKGDCVSTFMTNRPEYLFATYGMSRAGLVSVSINTAFKASFLHYPMETAGVKLLITEARLADVLLTMDMLPASLKTIVYVDGVPANVPSGNLTLLSWDDMLAGGSPACVFPGLAPGDTGAISFTSGTTGRSKGVVSPCLQALVMGREAAQAFGITPRDRVYTCMPLFHGMAQVTTGIAALYAGATIVLSKGFSVTNFWPELRSSGATQASGLGSMMQLLLTIPPTDQDSNHQVKRFFSAPAPPDVLYRFEQRFGVHVIEGYGSTEIKNVLYNPLEGRKVGSMGKPTATTIMEIHDEHDRRLPPGQVGELVYRPTLPNIMMSGYLNEPEKTLQGMRNLWWHTGDMGSVDEDGFFYFYDRTSDRLRRRGENISSQEVESIVSAYPGITETAAVAVPSELGEDEVLAVMQVANPGEFDFNALVAYCARTLPRHMVPRYYRLVTALPRTPTGKVQKNHLREQGLTDDTWDHVAAGITIAKHT